MLSPYKPDEAILDSYAPTQEQRINWAIGELRKALGKALPELLNVEMAYAELTRLGGTLETAAVDEAVEFGLTEFRHALKELS